jgi:hypothetical protein
MSLIAHLRRGPLWGLLLAVLATGSEVHADEVLPPVRINGLLLQITRLTGPELAARVAALEADWRVHSDAVLPWQERGAWRQLARRSGRWSEVLQVRGASTPAEAYLSRLDVQRAPAVVPRIPLPTGCRADSTVESAASGDAVVQVTGNCPSQSDAALRDWLFRLGASGWTGGIQDGGRVYRFRRGATELTALFALRAAESRAGLQGFTVLQRQIATKEP